MTIKMTMTMTMTMLKKAFHSFRIFDEYHLVWATLCLGGGILAYEFIPQHHIIYLAFFAVLSLFCWLVLRVWGAIIPPLQMLVAGFGFVCLGLASASFELWRHDYPILQSPQSAQISARIYAIDFHQPTRMRLYLDQIDSPHAHIQELNSIRVSTDRQPLLVGDRIEADVQLFTLSLPAFRGRPDYGRWHYMRGLSATGFIYDITAVHKATQINLRERLTRYRYALAERLAAQMPPPSGGLAAALLVGVRDYISDDVYQSFRDSGLAHLLAISGLHMGLFCFAVLWAIRSCFACFPSISQRYAVHKISAFIALGASAAYLFLAGQPISAVRAFLMAAIVILALIIDRRALTLRNLSLIAFIVLIFQPSLIFTAGFQLSFMASFAIVSALPYLYTMGLHSKFLNWLVFVVTTSALASIVTAPFVAYHFAQFTVWGVVANIIAIPLTGLLIMPLGILVLLSGFSSALDLTSWLMAQPLWVLHFVAMRVSAFSFAGAYIQPPAPLILIFFSLGFIGLMIRPWGHVVMGGLSCVCALILWGLQPYPQAALITERNRLILATKADTESLFLSAKLSRFWTSQVALNLGTQTTSIQPCPQRHLCILPYQGGSIALAHNRSALSPACDSRADLILSRAKPLYPCRSAIPIYWVGAEVWGRDEKWLIYITDKKGGKDIRLQSNKARLHPRPWRAP